jgi:poly(3-hydroxybutyrate) depolymerase
MLSLSKHTRKPAPHALDLAPAAMPQATIPEGQTMSADRHANIPPLPAFTVEHGQHSVSGLSSGAFMAVQLHLAHSASFVGAGIIAGGPYRCAQSYPGAAAIAGDAGLLNALYIAMAPLTAAVAPKAEDLATAARALADEGRIDAVANLADDRLYIFTGKRDVTLSKLAVEATRDFYLKLGVAEQAIRFVDDVAAGHAIITSNPEDSPLGATQPPYINFGGWMQSHDILEHIYPDLKPPAPNLPGDLLRFDQRPFFRHHPRASMNPYGYVYVPSKVRDGGRARAVHIALHGCKQGCGYVSETYGRKDTMSQPPFGTRFITTTGYNAIAESNDIIVLYPQVVGDDGVIQNNDGCWDWWGYSAADLCEPDYFTREAIQIKAIHGMLEHLCSGSEPPLAQKPDPAAEVLS